MPDPSQFLPPEALGWQGLGFAPMTAQQPPPPRPVFAGLPPELVQGMGGGPPLAQPPAPGASTPDYKVPTTAFSPAAPAVGRAPGAPAPAMRQSPDQEMRQGGQRQIGAVERQQDVARAQGELGAQKAQAEVPVYQQEADQAKQAIADETERNRIRQEKSVELQGNIDKAVKAEADYHVDPNRKWKSASTGQKIGSAFAIILSGIGQGMMHQGGNPALDIIQRGIQDDIEAQRGEKESLGRKVAGAQGAFANFRAMTNDDNEAAKLTEATHLRSTAADLRAAGAKYAAPGAKLAAESNAAELDARAGAIQAGVADKLADNHARNTALSLTARGQNLEQQRFDKTFTWNQKKEMDDLAYKYEALNQKAKADKAKLAGEKGLFNPTTGDPLLTARGRELYHQADSLEADARKAKTPEEGAALAKRATDLRDDAKATEVATIADEAPRAKVREQLAYAQQVVDANARIKQFLRSDPNAWDREEWAKAKTEYGHVVASYIKSLGANASSREFEAITDHVLNYDPGSIKDRLVGKAPGAASLDALDTLVRNGVDTQLKANGVKDGWVPRASDANPEASFGGKTSTEIGQGAEPSVIQRYSPLALITGPKAGEEWGAQKAARENAEARTDATGNRVISGLAPADDAKARSLITSAQGASAADRQRIVDSLAQPLLKGSKFDPTNENANPFGGRPSLGSGIISLVKAEDPQLYQEVLARLPPLQAQAIQQFDALFDEYGRPRTQAKGK